MILETVNDTTSKQILKLLEESDIEVERFGRYEPSLNDIFVAKVGEEA